MPQTLEFFATCLAGLERSLADELSGMGIGRTRPLRGGVAFFGEPIDAERVCLWSRLASRVTLVVGRVSAQDADALYAGIRALAWADVVAPKATIAVRAQGANDELRNTRFTALKVKDALCDALRDARGARPDVDARRPDAAIEVRVRDARATVSLDLSGAPLHARASSRDRDAARACAYASGLLAQAGWVGLAQAGWAFLDPTRDAGVLADEAAALADDMAPGLGRHRWGFHGWGLHPVAAWKALLAEARERAQAGEGRMVRRERALRDAPTLVACSFLPEEAADARFPAVLEAFFGACAAAPRGSRFALAGVPGAASRFGDGAREGEMGSGRIAVPVLVSDEPPTAGTEVVVPDAHGGAEHRVTVFEPASEQFAARLRKVAKERRKWARREGVTCYRVYDADLPEYAVAIDVYEGAREAEGRTFLHIAEYKPPASVDAKRAERRRRDVLAIAPVALGVPADHMFAKARMRVRGGARRGTDERRAYVTHVSEGGCLFEVDLSSHLDTGLFLDHRPTRLLIAEWACGARFLNLFGYTGAATVHAAAGGAAETTTVDLSNTYLAWARRNMELNGFDGPEHRFERADVMPWVAEARRAGERYDLVFVDPPTFSNSKAMGSRTWDVQRDHAELLVGVSRLLARDGVAVFSCNLRTFKPDADELSRYGVLIEDITARTIPHDFERTPRIHRCYLVRRA